MESTEVFHLVFCAVMVTVVTTEPPQCASECVCRRYAVLIVDCSRSQLEVVPKDLPSDAGLLDFSGNSLTGIDNQSFSQTLFKLTELVLDNNHINDINCGAFAKMPNLTSLHLDNNLLSSIPRDCFRGLWKLESLHISHNRLTQLSKWSFEGLDSLSLFVAEGNSLTFVELGTFQNMPKLSYLRLQSNNLTTLQEGLFNGSDSLIEVHLCNNDISFIHPRSFYENPILGKIDLTNNSLLLIPALPHARNLTRLILDGNFIADLSPRSFVHRENLETLSLNDSHVSSLEYEIFLFLPNLRQLFCKGNNLTWIDSRTGEYINRTTVVDMTDNRWVCDYNLHWVTAWAFNVSVFGNCSLPKKHKGKPVSSLTSADFYVAPEKLSSPTEFVFSSYEPLIVVCPVFGFPTPDISWSRKGNVIESSCNDDDLFYVEGIEGRMVNSSLYFKSPQKRLEGVFRCTATNEVGKLEVKIRLSHSWPWTVDGYKEPFTGTTLFPSLDSDKPKHNRRTIMTCVIVTLAILCLIALGVNAFFLLNRQGHSRVAPTIFERT